MKKYIFIKTMAKKKSYIKNDFLRKISRSIDKDMIWTSQRFIGKGFSELLNTESEEKIKKMKNGLNTSGIDFFEMNEDEINKRIYRMIKVSDMKEADNHYILEYLDGKLELSKNDDILIIAGIDQMHIEKPSLQAIQIEGNYSIFIYFKNAQVIAEIDSKSTNLSGLKNASKFSRTENIKILLNEVKMKANKYFEDMEYSANYMPGLSVDMKSYVCKASLLFDLNYYEYNYPKEIFEQETNKYENQFDYDYNYKVYAPNERILQSTLYSKFNLKLLLNLPLIVVFIFYFIGKTQPGLYIFNFFNIIFFIYYVFLFVKYFRFKSLIEDIPTSTIESLSIGLREIKGTILDRNAIPSLVSGIKCVFYRYFKYSKVKTDKGEQWVLVEIGEYLPERFFIQNNGYVMEVETRKSILDIHNKAKYMTPFYLMKSFIRDKNTYYIEESLPVYNDVYIMGSVINKDSRESFNTFLKSRKNDTQYMKQFDKNNDNQIDMNEWEKAKKQIEIEFNENQAEKKQNEILKMCHTKDDGLFFISDKSEKELIKGLNIYLILTLIYGALSFVLTLNLIWR